MKRSEMLKLIREALWMEKIDHKAYEEQILSTVEHLGMSPPFSPDVFMKQKNKWGVELANGREWDPEDSDAV